MARNKRRRREKKKDKKEHRRNVTIPLSVKNEERTPNSQPFQEEESLGILDDELKENQHISWSFGEMDFGGPFGWEKCKKSDKLLKILKRKKALEGSDPPFDQDKKNHHFIKLNKLSKDARDRLDEIKKDDIEELFSIRIKGKERVFAIARRPNIYSIVYSILWWDPEHKVCPSNLRNT